MLPNKTDLEESHDVMPFRLSQVLIENCLKTGLQKAMKKVKQKLLCQDNTNAAP